MFKRGDVIEDIAGNRGTVLGPEDFKGYDYNKPRSGTTKWELVLWFFDGSSSWISHNQLKKEVFNV
jgi:hypothetical protein